MDEKKTHGGRRKGAGRKKKYVRKVTFNATAKTLEILEQQERQAQYINEAIQEKNERR